MQIKSLNIGSPQTIATTKGSFMSAIRKQPTSEEIELTYLGLEGDHSCEDAHGGKEKALHMFCFENYAFFETRAQATLQIPTFGENITIHDYDELQARVGDVIQIANAVVQISEPTIRCNKIGRAAGHPLMLKWIQEQFKTGFYLRVLQEGKIAVNSPIKLIDRGSDYATIDHLNRVMFCHSNEKELVEKVLQTPALSEGWKHTLKKRAKML